MKKLMIAACAMAMAVAAQAASVTWSATSSVVYNPGGATRVSEGAAAYLISASDWSRTELLSAFDAFGGTAAGFASSSAWKSAAQIGTTTTSANGKIKSTPLTSSILPSVEGTTRSAYYVIINGDNLYLTGELPSDYVKVGDKYTFAFTTAYTPADSSKAARMEAGSGLGSSYSGAGWYYNDVPEPTSAMLLLLGVAGLALKRKRA